MGPMLCAVLLSLVSAVPTPLGGRRAYELRLDGQRVGRATLEVAGDPRREVHYAWLAEIAAGGRGCLVAKERREGAWRSGDPRGMPEEVALPVLLALGDRRTALDLGRAGSARGAEATAELVLTRRDGREAFGTDAGEPFHALLGRDLLPDAFELPRLGLAYRAVPWAPPEEIPCEGQAAPLPLTGLPAGLDPRGLRRARFLIRGDGLPRQVESERAGDPLAPGISAVLREAYARSPGRECQRVARALRRELARRGHRAVVVGGFVLDAGRLWPHAWVRLQTAQGPVSLDATTGTAAADAGRIEVGPLEGAGALATGFALLRWRHASVTLADWR
ncbi:MAG: lasso peptide biosynthesis protein [Deltaproteobacteria bacterium]